MDLSIHTILPLCAFSLSLSPPLSLSPSLSPAALLPSTAKPLEKSRDLFLQDRPLFPLH